VKTVSGAGGQAEHPVLAAGAGQAVVQGGERGGPVDDGQAGAVAGGADEAAGEVGAREEHMMADVLLDADLIRVGAASPRTPTDTLHDVILCR
jgi:hypothetical protein